MQRNYALALQRLLAHEGGYTNHPADPGGPTNFGITLGDYQHYIDPSGGADDVQHMTVLQASQIYAAHYATPLRFNDLPDGVDYCEFDYGVHSGIGRATRVLQHLAGVDPARTIDDITLAYVRARDPKVLVAAICDERLKFLQNLSTWETFGNGWATRVREVRACALQMAGASQNIVVNPITVRRSELPWMQRLNALLGLYEFPGGADNPAILAMASACGGNIKRNYDHDEIPWCALNENYILISSGFPGTDSLMALAFRNYGSKLLGPAIGAIGTKTRAGAPGSGHVFNIVGRTIDGLIVGRGGNQSDMVCDTTFNEEELQYNWPPNYPLPESVGFELLPIVRPLPHVKKGFTSLPDLTPGVSQATGKPGSSGAGKVVGVGGGSSAIATGGAWDWVAGHPVLAGVAATGAAVMIGGMAYTIWRNHETMKTKPMNVIPVMV